MTEKPKPPKLKDEPGANERFAKGIAKALATPPQPHNPAPKPKKQVKR